MRHISEEMMDRYEKGELTNREEEPVAVHLENNCTTCLELDEKVRRKLGKPPRRKPRNPLGMLNTCGFFSLPHTVCGNRYVERSMIIVRKGGGNKTKGGRHDRA